jgi:hyperosmotically inducible periplasmic protein
MKKIFSNFLAIPLYFLLGSAVLVSCKPKDSDIQAGIDAKVKGMSEASAVTYSVKDGVVTLGGETKAEAGKYSIETAVKDVKGVKQVVNNISVVPEQAPIVITADDPLKQSVSDATKDYPGVNASVSDGTITLTGEIKRDDLKKLMMNLNTLKPRKIENQLKIK